MNLPHPDRLDGEGLWLDPNPASWQPAYRLSLDDEDFYRWGYVSHRLSKDREDGWIRQRSLVVRLGRAWCFATRARNDGRIVGTIEVELKDANGTEGEIGYWTLPHERGAGFATAALRLLTASALAAGVMRIVLPIHPENVASAAVARKAGYRSLGLGSVWPPIGGSSSAMLFEIRES